ncbi:MAG: DUF5908 family protein [Cyclobacteriaceae bacterium]
MPVEIKELVIVTEINSGNSTADSRHVDAVDKEEIIQACVSQVMKIMEKKNKR